MSKSSYHIKELNEKLDYYLQTAENMDKPCCHCKNIRSLLDNLQAYQIELEVNNRQLIASRTELEAARDKYANLYDFSPIGYVSFDASGCIKNINLTACEMFESDRSLLLEKPFSIFLSLVDAQSFFRHIKEVLLSEEKSSVQLEIKSRKGRTFFIELESNCNVFGDGDKNIQSAIIDITDRVAAKKIQSENDQQLHSIIDALPILIAHIDSSFQYIFTNKAHDKTFPTADGKYTGKSLRTVIGDEFFSSILPHVNLALEGHEVICEIAASVSKQKVTFRVNLLPKLPQNASSASFFLIMSDITMHKQKEMDVMRHLSDLAHEARINLIGQMTAEIAHEINQPLAAIANYSVAGIRLQRTGKLEANEIIDIFQEIDDQVHRASEIINHLKHFSKNRELQLTKKDINQLIVEVLKLMIVDEYWHGVKIKTELCESMPCVCIDELLIEQVLINLLRNAVEAMIDSAQKKLLITIKTEYVDKNIIISITDTGPMLPYDMLDHIFVPFFSTKKSGVGLGLSICKSIVESHNGKLWAARNYPTGTTFFIQIPIGMGM